MYELDNCMSHYRRLLSLLEEDSREIAKGFQGELLQGYQETIQKEVSVLSQKMRTVYSINKQ